MYLPESAGTRSRSFRYQRETFKYGSKSRLFRSFPSFNHLYLSGGAPVAWHFSRMECDAGHALNDLFSNFGSLNTGALAKARKRKTKIIKLVSTYLPTNDGNRTMWSPIRSVTIRVVTKSNERRYEAGVRFANREDDYRQLDNTTSCFQLIKTLKINYKTNHIYKKEQLTLRSTRQQRVHL